jgi:hypothetical protein
MGKVPDAEHGSPASGGFTQSILPPFSMRILRSTGMQEGKPQPKSKDGVARFRIDRSCQSKLLR